MSRVHSRTALASATLADPPLHFPAGRDTAYPSRSLLKVETSGKPPVGHRRVTGLQPSVEAAMAADRPVLRGRARTSGVGAARQRPAEQRHGAEIAMVHFRCLQIRCLQIAGDGAFESHVSLRRTSSARRCKACALSVWSLPADSQNEDHAIPRTLVSRLVSQRRVSRELRAGAGLDLQRRARLDSALFVLGPAPSLFETCHEDQELAEVAEGAPSGLPRGSPQGPCLCYQQGRPTLQSASGLRPVGP